MENKFRNIVEEPFKICSYIKDYNELLVYSINNAPESSLNKFLIRTKPIWEVYSRKEWNSFIEKVDNEIAFLSLTIFFGRYLRIDLIESVHKWKLKVAEKNIKYVDG